MYENILLCIALLCVATMIIFVCFIAVFLEAVLAFKFDAKNDFKSALDMKKAFVLNALN